MLVNFFIETYIVSPFLIMVETVQKCVMTFYSSDLRTSKFLSNFNGSFVFISILVIFLSLGLSFSYLWAPFQFWNIKRNLQTQYESNEGKELVSTKSQKLVNEQLFTNGNIRQNFLPDSQELQVYDDDTVSIRKSPEVFRPKIITSHENSEEATRALHMAVQMKEQGKHEKALKLFQHAMALNPLHSDVLNHYGEFLEEQDNNIIQANHLYTRALTISPQHYKAMLNRQRTLPVVEDLDLKQLLRIDKKRDYLIQVPNNDPALKRVKKEAYFQHIHHTVAIEGNTMTLAETRMIVETRMAVPGKSIMEHNEILGLEAALKYINSTLVSKIGMIFVSDILQIHKRVLGHVDPMDAGSFRRSQVYVGEHTPPPASEVNDLMEDFVDWLNSEAAFNMHPVKYAALAHYKLVQIHPFIDGNGRTGRLLMNLILMRVGYPPVIIRKQDRSLYYEFLQLANEGDIRPFIRFIAKCTERTLDVYLYATEYGMAGIKALEAQENESHVRIIEM